MGKMDSSDLGCNEQFCDILNDCVKEFDKPKKEYPKPVDVKMCLGEILDASHDAYVVLDGCCRLLFINEAAEKLLGYTFDESIGLRLGQLINLDEKLHTYYCEAYQDYIKTKSDILSSLRPEVKAKNKAGKTMNLELSFTPLSVENNLYVTVIMHDITRMKEMLQRVETSKKQYAELADNAPLGIVSCDADGNIEYINEILLDMLGSKDHEETSKINLISFPLLIENGFSKKLLEAINSRQSITFQTQYQSIWNKLTDLMVYIKPRITNYKVTGAQMIVEDYSDRVKLEEEMKKKEERLLLMIKGIPSPAWLVSKSFRILAQNDAAESMFQRAIGDYCWAENAQLETSFFYKHGKRLRNESINDEIEFEGMIWDTWWIPLGEDVYLYYANNVTKYKKYEEELIQLSTTDALTHAYNRRYFEQRLDEEIERVKRGGPIFSLIMLDIDHFKRVNDTYGHNHGDLVLVRVADEILKNRIRKIDSLARWGGEEFMLLLPETRVEKATILAEELRLRLSRVNFREVGKVTASFGVVEYELNDTYTTIIEKVDAMMYKAKDEGRNCVRRMK